MRNRILQSIIVAFGILLRLQAQILDDFNDGDFSNNPVWNGNTSDFTVLNNQLRSNSTVASTSFYLSTPSSLVNNCQWEFWCNLQFNTSSANWVDVYLIADQSNLMATNLNGYFIRIGNTQDDICLYKNTNGTALKIIDGVDGTTNSSNSVLKIKVIRDNANQFTLYSDITGTGNLYSTEGSIIDNSFLTNNAFGIVIKQSTASFFQKHFFDDFYAGAVILDQIPPQLVSATATSSATLDIFFNEDVDAITAQLNSNYSADNGLGNPTSAVRDAANFSLVHLTFPVSFASGLNYSVAVSNVQDVAGNPIAGTPSVPFIYYNLSSPAFHDVIINEIMADPNPAVGSLPLVEWIEVYNKSNKTFDLNAWKFSDGVSTASLNSKYFLPGQYIILCKNADTALLSSFGLSCGMSSMPTLNDAGDNLYLKDNSGNVIDSINYSSNWYNDQTKSGGGWSLELINPNQNAGCTQSSNWSASTNANGASPGQQNSIFSTAPDITGPATISISVIDSLHIAICFDETPDPTTSNLTSSYFINNGIGFPNIVNTSALNPKCVEITLGTALINATNYTVNYTSLFDCWGNSVSPSNFNFSYYIPKFNDVVVNEIMADPDPPLGWPNFEYVELYNRTNFSINLNNFSIATPSSTKLIPEIVILPDSFVVLTGSSGYAAYQSMNLPVYMVTSFPSLTNTGSTITLKNAAGKIINTVTYSDNWYQDPNKSEGGYSLEMIDPNNPCAGEENWKASSAFSGGTPGKTNSVSGINPDLTLPRLKRISVISPDTIQLFFSEKTDSTTLLTISNYSIDNSIGQPIAVIPVPVDFLSVKLALPVQLQNGIIYTCTLSNQVTDCAGNMITSPDNVARFALPQVIAPGDIVINELLFDPKTGGVDFVELYNKSSKTLDLGSLKIGEQDTLTGTFTDMENISNEGYLFFPGEYIVLSENGSIVKSQYSTPNPNWFLDMANLPAMNSDNDVVVITDLTNQLIDRVAYTSDFHFDLLNDTKGVSLERIEFNRPSSDITNWNSAASSAGFATPASRNSQYSVGQESGEVNLNPEAFSPDNDGFQDVLNIYYSLENAGQMANILIFDANGRLIRRLLKNETLAQKGTISWNGLSDQNEKAPVGIYVVYFESFEPNGKVHKFKRGCVLAGKL